ncbi:hypothetical protein BDD12DRAFT_914474 [Trichophaea hybrida]|nr:hypothetical protein BDD12DRAFT_914474 [Trichophaea hybrida]
MDSESDPAPESNHSLASGIDTRMEFSTSTTPPDLSSLDDATAKNGLMDSKSVTLGPFRMPARQLEFGIPLYVSQIPPLAILLTLVSANATQAIANLRQLQTTYDPPLPGMGACAVRRLRRLYQIRQLNALSLGHSINLENIISAYEHHELDGRPEFMTIWVAGVRKTPYIPIEDTEWQNNVPRWVTEERQGSEVWVELVRSPSRSPDPKDTC